MWFWLTRFVCHPGRRSKVTVDNLRLLTTQTLLTIKHSYHHGRPLPVPMLLSRRRLCSTSSTDSSYYLFYNMLYYRYRCNKSELVVPIVTSNRLALAVVHSTCSSTCASSKSCATSSALLWP